MHLVVLSAGCGILPRLPPAASPAASVVEIEDPLLNVILQCSSLNSSLSRRASYGSQPLVPQCRWKPKPPTGQYDEVVLGVSVDNLEEYLFSERLDRTENLSHV